MSSEIIIDPVAPISVKPRTINRLKPLVLKNSSSKERAKLIGMPVGPACSSMYIRDEKTQDTLQSNEPLKSKINKYSPAPCETILFDLGVKLQDNGQIVNIEDVKSWELINGPNSSYLGKGNLNIGQIEHDPKKTNLLLRGHDNDRVISESLTYINTAASSDMVVNLTFRDSMPRCVAPVNDLESNSYILNVIKKRMGSKYRKNCLYIVKTNVFRASDAQAAQRLYEYIESFDKQEYISKTALKEAALIRKKVHELICTFKGIKADDVNKLNVDYPYTDTTLGVIHAIYCIGLSSIPGYTHDEGQVFVTNLDMSVNIGLHQAPPLHPVAITYNNAITFNPGYLQKCTPQVFTGYAYYVKNLNNQPSIYVVVGGQVLSIDPQSYPIAIDCNNDIIDNDFIRVFSHDKQPSNGEDTLEYYLKPVTTDISIEQAFKSGVAYKTYEDAKLHLDKFGTSISVDLSKAKSELMVHENKSKELIQLNEIADKKHKSLLAEIESANEQLALKKKIAEVEYDSKISQEQEKRETIREQVIRDLQMHQQKMQATQYSAEADRSIGGLKVFAAALGAAGAGIAFAKLYVK